MGEILNPKISVKKLTDTHQNHNYAKTSKREKPNKQKETIKTNAIGPKRSINRTTKAMLSPSHKIKKSTPRKKQSSGYSHDVLPFTRTPNQRPAKSTNFMTPNMSNRSFKTQKKKKSRSITPYRYRPDGLISKKNKIDVNVHNIPQKISTKTYRQNGGDKIITVTKRHPTKYTPGYKVTTITEGIKSGFVTMKTREESYSPEKETLSNQTSHINLFHRINSQETHDFICRSPISSCRHSDFSLNLNNNAFGGYFNNTYSGRFYDQISEDITSASFATDSFTPSNSYSHWGPTPTYREHRHHFDHNFDYHSPCWDGGRNRNPLLPMRSEEADHRYHHQRNIATADNSSLHHSNSMGRTGTAYNTNETLGTRQNENIFFNRTKSIEHLENFNTKDLLMSFNTNRASENHTSPPCASRILRKLRDQSSKTFDRTTTNTVTESAAATSKSEFSCGPTFRPDQSNKAFNETFEQSAEFSYAPTISNKNIHKAESSGTSPEALIGYPSIGEHSHQKSNTHSSFTTFRGTGASLQESNKDNAIKTQQTSLQNDDFYYSGEQGGRLIFKPSIKAFEKKKTIAVPAPVVEGTSFEKTDPTDKPSNRDKRYKKIISNKSNINNLNVSELATDKSNFEQSRKVITTTTENTTSVEAQEVHTSNYQSLASKSRSDSMSLSRSRSKDQISKKITIRGSPSPTPSGNSQSRLQATLTQNSKKRKVLPQNMSTPSKFVVMKNYNSKSSNYQSGASRSPNFEENRPRVVISSPKLKKLGRTGPLIVKKQGATPHAGTCESAIKTLVKKTSVCSQSNTVIEKEDKPSNSIIRVRQDIELSPVLCNNMATTKKGVRQVKLIQNRRQPVNRIIQGSHAHEQEKGVKSPSIGRNQSRSQSPQAHLYKSHSSCIQIEENKKTTQISAISKEENVMSPVNTEKHSGGSGDEQSKAPVKPFLENFNDILFETEKKLHNVQNSIRGLKDDMKQNYNDFIDYTKNSRKNVSRVLRF